VLFSPLIATFLGENSTHSAAIHIFGEFGT
jgi:hypothetical protein